ncbi:MAG: PH domain-containing protein [Candidatus Saccharimonadales bacterium]
MSKVYSTSPLIKINSELSTANTHKARVLAIKTRIKTLGADMFDLTVLETQALPYVLHPGESINGIVYGRYQQEKGNVIGRGALIATNNRVLLVDKKPMFIRSDEVIYSAVSGVTYTRVGFIGTVTLHSKIGDIKVRTLNQKCAKSFVDAVEAQIMQSGNAPGGNGS